jgi:hypothetical protein
VCYVLCLIGVRLPTGKNPFAVPINKEIINEYIIHIFMLYNTHIHVALFNFTSNAIRCSASNTLLCYLMEHGTQAAAYM